MKIQLIACLALACGAHVAGAATIWCSSHDMDTGQHGLFGHHSFHGNHFGHFSSDDVLPRLEDKLASLMEDFDEQSMDPDFFTSDEYGDFIDSFEHFVDRFAWLVDRQEWKLDHVESKIERTTSALDRFDQWLEEFLDRDNIPEEKREHVQMRLETVRDFFAMRLDALTDKQTMLNEDLEDYSSFQTDLDMYLAEIKAAGETPVASGQVADLTSNADDGAASVELSLLEAPTPAADALLASTSGLEIPAAISVVPEPPLVVSTLTLLLAAWAVRWTRRHRRRKGEPSSRLCFKTLRSSRRRQTVGAYSLDHYSVCPRSGERGYRSH